MTARASDPNAGLFVLAAALAAAGLVLAAQQMSVARLAGRGEARPNV